ncbi:MAG: T9SS type A sorting domain-containing protein [Flavobacteriales bacterium]|nr:T9SS type A sorting domain-containing protein [Flavobacteriales bacterium]
MKKTLLLVSAVFLHAAAVQAQSICFDPESDNRYATGEGAQMAVVADFDDDGNLDAATADRFDGTISVLFGNGDGTFQPRLVVYPGLTTVQRLVVTDLNSDNQPDLLARGSDGSLSMLINNGNGFQGFQVISGMPVAGNYAQMVGADLNNDTRIDVVINDPTNHRAMVLANNGNSSLTPLDTIYTTGTPEHLALGDLNNDNWPDLVMSFENTTTSNDSVHVYLNDGNGHFSFSQAIFIASAFPVSRMVHIADLDADGFGEIICEGIADLRVFLNDQSMGFLLQPTVQMGGYASSIVTGHFNADAILDLAETQRTSGVVAVRFGNGNGTFQALNSFSVNGSPNHGALGDFDGDLQVDLISSNTQSNASFVKGNADGSFGTYMLRSGLRPMTFAVGLVNNDAYLDIVTHNTQSYDISVMLGNGDGSFQNTVNQGSLVYGDQMIMADLNNDDELDVAVVSTEVTMLQGDGNGTFVLAGTSPQTFQNGGTFVMAAADLNADDNIDLVLGLNSEDSISVLLGNGDFTFQPVLRYATEGILNGDITIALVNADTYPDLITANDQSNDLSLFINNGSGGFLSPTLIQADNGPRSVAVDDFDGNGMNDLVVVNNNSLNVTVHLATSPGVFAIGVPYFVDNSPGSVTTGLVNNDAIPDIIVTRYSSSAVAALFGNGDGTFQSAAQYTVEAGPSQAILADFNQDGALDISTVNNYANNVSVILNNSSFIGLSGPAEFCDGDSVTLSASNGFTYLWSTGETTPSITVHTEDEYSVQIFNQSGTCTLVPPLVPVTVITSNVTVTLNDPNLDPLCETGSNYSLQGGNPQGGTYSGTGVTNGIFNPSVAGDGNHTITYSYTDPAGCATASATEIIQVDAAVNAVISLATDTLCESDAIIVLSGIGTPSGGEWMIDQTAATSLDPSQLALGTHTLSYSVTIGACSDLAEVDFVMTVCAGIDEAAFRSNFSLYPNPTNGEVQLQSRNGNSITEISVYDVNGKNLLKEKANSSNAMLQMDQFSSGMYMLEVVSNAGRFMQRLEVLR